MVARRYRVPGHRPLQSVRMFLIRLERLLILVLRIGQTKPVHVYQLIAEDTVESKVHNFGTMFAIMILNSSQVLDIQEKKKKLIQQAFSGIKSKETLRQKKEARLQGK